MNFREIDRLKAELDGLRPLPPEVMRKLNEKLRLDWNYHSNALEGNTLTYGETKALLLHDRYIGNKEGRHYREIRAHDDVIQSLDELVKNEEQYPLSEKLIKELHEQMLGESYLTHALTSDGQETQKWVIPGRYKTQPNSVRRSTGDMFFYADPVEVPGRMGELLEEYRKQNEDPTIHPIQLAAWFHYVFIRIHPFDDGNGRLARILMNLILMRRGYVPAIVPVEAKAEYLDALQLVDATDELEPFIEVIAKHVQRILDLEIRAAKGEDISEPEDWKKEIKVLKSYIREEPKILYIKEIDIDYVIRTMLIIRDCISDIFNEVADLFKEKVVRINRIYQGQVYYDEDNEATNFNDLDISMLVQPIFMTTEYMFEFECSRFSRYIKDDIYINAYIRLKLEESQYTISSEGFYKSQLYSQEIQLKDLQWIKSSIGKRLAMEIRDFIGRNQP